MQQALDRAVANGVKNLVVQPTHLMHGAEYDEMKEAIDGYKDKFESVAIAEPMLGEVGDDATVINDDKKAVAQAITDEACKEAGFDDMKAAADAQCFSSLTTKFLSAILITIRQDAVITPIFPFVLAFAIVNQFMSFYQ